MWIAYMVLYSNYFSKKEQQKATSKVIMACNLGMCLAFVFSSCFYGKMGMAFLCGAGVIAGIAGVIGGIFVKEDLMPMTGKGVRAILILSIPRLSEIWFYQKYYENQGV